MTSKMSPTRRMMEMMSPLNGKERMETLGGIMQKNCADYMKSSFSAKEGDLFIVTFPKCGTTWTQEIVKLIRNHGQEDGVDVDDAIPWLELMSPEEADAVPHPRGFKSHLPYNRLPGGEPCTTPAKYISVYRNPKDLTVSMYYHLRNFMLSEMPWNQFFEVFMSGKFEGQTGGNCFEYFLEWWKHKDAENILVISYEWMKQNHHQAVKTIAKFIGYDLPPSVINSIVGQTTFNKMKTNPAANMSWADALHGDGSTPFMRKGIVGDWKNYYTEEQSARMDEEIKKKLEGTGLKFEY